MNRESWLEAAAKLLAPLFAEHEAELPEVRVAVGFPSVRALSAKKQRIGECWAAEAADDKRSQIFVSPLLADGVEALGVLAHELVHAAVGCEHGHDATFGRLARAIGLEGKMTATTVGPGLRLLLEEVVKVLGPYPHAKLNPALSGKKKQGTRMILVKCPACDYQVRATRKWIDVGLPTCPCGAEMKAELPDEDESEEDG